MGDVVVSLGDGEARPASGDQALPGRALAHDLLAHLSSASVGAAMRLRGAGIDVEIYPEPAKMAKQVLSGYADQLGIPFAVILGPEEAAQGRVALRWPPAIRSCSRSRRPPRG